MLNLSPDGIACRVPQQDAGPLEIGQTVHVAFRLGGSTSVFDLTAGINNITRGGTPGQLVVGLEFMVGQRLEAGRAALREVLETIPVQSPKRKRGVLP